MRRANNALLFLSMKILAFDQATKVTGFAIIVDGVLVKHGTFKANAAFDIVTRMYYVADAVGSMVFEESPDVVMLEGVEGVKNERTMIFLANLQGMCLMSARCQGRIADVIDVATWRHTLGFEMGRGVKRDDLKAQAIKYVANEYGVICGDDEAEAICIASATWKKYLDSKESKESV